MSPTTAIRAPSAASPGRDPGDAVQFLVAQLPDAQDPGSPARHRGGEAEDRDLVDRRGDLVGRHVDPAQLAAPNDEVRERLPALLVARRADGALLDVGAHPSQQVDDRTPGRVRADIPEGQLRVRVRGRRHQPERGARDVAGDALVQRAHVRHPVDRVDGPAAGEPLRAHGHAAGAQHPLGVVAGGHRLADGRRPGRRQPGQQDRRLHLGAGNGRRVVDGDERARAP